MEITSESAKIQTRSMAFFNWRIFPGQGSDLR